MMQSLWNAIKCFFGWHDVPETTHERLTGYLTQFEVFRCARCRQQSHLIERTTGLRYHSLDQYLLERSYL